MRKTVHAFSHSADDNPPRVGKYGSDLARNFDCGFHWLPRADDCNRVSFLQHIDL